MPVLVYLCGIVLILTIGELTPRAHHLLSESTICCSTQVEALVANVEAKAHGHIGVRIAKLSLVVGIDLTIVVDIHKFQITRLDVCSLQ